MTTATAEPRALPDYESVIGLETHVELGTVSKMFCGCPTAFGAEPNTQVCAVCLGLPGALPAVNEAAIAMTVRIGLALNCAIAPWCRFARKNYFYPDMPKNFQISQYDEPLCVGGHLDVNVGGQVHRVGITRVHMEEDTGKSLHVGGSDGRISGATHSLLDYNRAGVPLVEIVTEPDIRSADVARAYVAELRELLRALGVSEVRMEQGQLRCDANVSLRPRGSEVFGTRTETKNLNSLRSVERAITYEIGRQSELLGSGGRVVQETRHFDEARGITQAGRTKEEATDYRYFPEPDLLPVALERAYVDAIRDALPELPAARRARLSTQFGFSPLDLEQMVGAGVLDLVEDTIAAGAPPDAARAWWLNELARAAVERGVEPSQLPMTGVDVARVIELISAGTLTNALARQVVTAVLDGEGTPDEVMADRGLALVEDTDALAAACDAAIADAPEIAEKVRGGKDAAVGPLVGAVMKAMRGSADAAKVRALLLERLKAS
jgi:aspartyl-tRNA(Asn)/glutamyl-tRNA(Gln) amidotransferase subunit B